MQASIDNSHNKLKSKKLKGTYVICVSENLLLRKHAERIFHSPVIPHRKQGVITSELVRKRH